MLNKEIVNDFLHSKYENQQAIANKFGTNHSKFDIEIFEDAFQEACLYIYQRDTSTFSDKKHLQNTFNQALRNKYSEKRTNWWSKVTYFDNGSIDTTKYLISTFDWLNHNPDKIKYALSKMDDLFYSLGIIEKYGKNLEKIILPSYECIDKSDYFKGGENDISAFVYSYKALGYPSSKSLYGSIIRSSIEERNSYYKVKQFRDKHRKRYVETMRDTIISASEDENLDNFLNKIDDSFENIDEESPMVMKEWKQKKDAVSKSAKSSDANVFFKIMDGLLRSNESNENITIEISEEDFELFCQYSKSYLEEDMQGNLDIFVGFPNQFWHEVYRCNTYSRKNSSLREEEEIFYQNTVAKSIKK